MASHNDFGKEAEIEAQKYLKTKDYEIIETNWRYNRAEIDIIAKKQSELIIVEVKARSSNEVINPEEAVNFSKRKLLLMAANEYVENYKEEVEVRFDIISLLKKETKWDITHIENAFNALL